MTTIVYKKTYSAPPIDRIEALRYAGVRGKSEEAEELLGECIRDAESVLTYKLTYAELPVSRDGNSVDFGFAKAHSEKLSSHLSDCESVIIFAATVGIGIDRLIAKASRTSPSRSLMLQGLGAERTEALCDLFEEEMRAKKATEGRGITHRFSAGYGDLSLEFQREIFRLLDCQKGIGLTLSESLLMSPTKSVTAIIGVKKAEK